MNVYSFKYLKKDSTEPKDYRVFVMSSDEKGIWALSLDALSEDEQKQFEEIQNNYEKALQPFKKALRNFKVESIVKADKTDEKE